MRQILTVLYFLGIIHSTGFISAQKTNPVLFDRASQTIKLSDNTYLGAGYAFNANQSTRYAWIVKTDTTSKIEWEKTIENGIGSVASSAYQMSAESIIIGGTNYTSINTSDIFLQKINFKGKKIWEKALNLAESEELIAITVSKNKEILVLASENSSNNKHFILNIVKTDSLGNTIWKTSINDGEIFNKYIKRYGSDIAESPDGNIMIMGNKYSHLDRKSKFWIMKLNSDGSKNWEETYNEYAQAVIFSTSQNSLNLIVKSQPEKDSRQTLIHLQLDKLGNLIEINQMSESLRPSVTCLTAYPSGLAEYTSFTRMSCTKDIDFWATATEELAPKNTLSLLFEKSGQVTLSKDQEKELLKNLEMLKNSKYILIEGFADAKGTFETNMRISYKRVVSIENILLKNGINPSHVIGKPHGNTKSLINEQTLKEGNTEDRKAIIHIY